GRDDLLPPAGSASKLLHVNRDVNALPEGCVDELVDQLKEPGEAAFPIPDSGTLSVQVLDACGWTCCLTHRPIPKAKGRRADRFVSTVLPPLAGGFEQPGNLIAVQPELSPLIASGAISFEDDGALLLSPRRLPEGLLQALGPDYRLRQPPPPFQIAARTLQLHPTWSSPVRSSFPASTGD
ncbi:MAG TPA: hypothetical protein VFE52_01795, partial [Devosia sp.]|nr:hypothetical protein [Devosia sp.]